MSLFPIILLGVRSSELTYTLLTFPGLKGIMSVLRNLLNFSLYLFLYFLYFLINSGKQCYMLGIMPTTENTIAICFSFVENKLIYLYYLEISTESLFVFTEHCLSKHHISFLYLSLFWL